MARKAYGWAFAAVYVAAIFMANWLIVHVGFIEVFPAPGRGGGYSVPPPHQSWVLYAPAGVYMAGLTFPARDFVQRALGWQWGVILIIVAAGLTWLISPTLAFASGFTFLVSESLDCTLYTWLRERFLRGVAISSTAAAVVDSLLFLHLAHIPYSVALAGQIVGKLTVVWLVGMPIAGLLRKSRALAVTPA